MKHYVSLFCIFTILSACFFIATSAEAQSYFNKRSSASGSAANAADNKPSEEAVIHAGRVAAACLEGWETQSCLSTVSESNLVMAANYAAMLEKNAKTNAMEDLKQHCAASTAATQGEYPAYAMRSAFVECANIISDITYKTNISPDKSHYQLLVGAVLCLDGDHRCTAIEQGLARY